MATLTSRLGLTKPATTEDYSVGVVNTNADLIDASIGASPATSTTRPSTQLYDGRLIHEDDTNELGVWRGSVWRGIGTQAATANRIARRLTGGRLKVGTATEADDAVTLAQLHKAVVPVSFSAGWVNYDSTSFEDAVVWVTGKTGTVQGLVRNVNGIAAGASAVSICTLPAGYRPRAGAATKPTLQSANGNVAVRVDLSAAGVLSFNNVLGPAIASGSFITLNLDFLTD